MSVRNSIAPQLAPGPSGPSFVISTPQELATLLQRFCEATTLHGRRSSFVQIVRWTREGAGAADGLSRLAVLLDVLEGDAVLRGALQQPLGKLLAEIDSLSLFAEVGLPS